MSSFHLKINNNAGQIFPNSLSNDMLIYASDSNIKNIWIGGSNTSNCVQISSNLTTVKGSFSASNFKTLDGLEIIDSLGNLSNVQNCTVSNLTVIGTVKGIVSVGSNVTTSNIYTSNVYTSNLAISESVSFPTNFNINTGTGSVTAGTFSGSGTGLTNIQASAISSGVLSTTYGGTGSTSAATGTGGVVLNIAPTISAPYIDNFRIYGQGMASNVQGAYMQWNRDGTGKTHIFGNQGLGPGGIDFGHINIANGAYIQDMHLDVSGTLYVPNVKTSSSFSNSGLMYTNQLSNMGDARVSGALYSASLSNTGLLTSGGLSNYGGFCNVGPISALGQTITAGTFSGSGTGLTNIPGAQVTGTVANATTAASCTGNAANITGTLAVALGGTGATQITGTAGSLNVLNNAPLLSNASNLGTFSNSGLMYTNQLSNIGDARVSGVLYSASHSNTGLLISGGLSNYGGFCNVGPISALGQTITAGTFSGNGSLLSNLNMSAPSMSGVLSTTYGGTGVTSATGNGSVVLSNAPTISSPLIDNFRITGGGNNIASNVQGGYMQWNRDSSGKTYIFGHQGGGTGGIDFGHINITNGGYVQDMHLDINGGLYVRTSVTADSFIGNATTASTCTGNAATATTLVNNPTIYGNITLAGNGHISQAYIANGGTSGASYSGNDLIIGTWYGVGIKDLSGTPTTRIFFDARQGNMSCTGTVTAGAVYTPSMTMDNFRVGGIGIASNVQGAYIQWNRDGNGRTHIFGNQGLGPGGTEFGHTTSAGAYTYDMFLDTSGALTTRSSVTATSFYGSGANLTNLPAAQISGNLDLGSGTITTTGKITGDGSRLTSLNAANVSGTFASPPSVSYTSFQRSYFQFEEYVIDQVNSSGAALPTNITLPTKGGRIFLLNVVLPTIGNGCGMYCDTITFSRSYFNLMNANSPYWGQISLNNNILQYTPSTFGNVHNRPGQTIQITWIPLC